jgi:hypothetical protein
VTRDSQLPPDEEEAPPDEGDSPQGSLNTTGPGLVAGCFLVGVVLGRVLPIIVEERGGVAPQVSWLSVFVLYFVAAIIGYVAWSTYRTIHRQGRRLETNQAVNRLVLAKACAIAGSLLAGGYFGYALAWIHPEGTLEQERLLHALLAALASVLVVAGSLALERACRVRNPPNHP